MATYAIGDVQGCGVALSNLLTAIGFSPERDRLWFVGDLVNKGPDSLGVLRRVKSLGPAALLVLGNHDLRFLSLAEGCVRPPQKHALQELLNAPDRDELVQWLIRQPLLHQEGRFLLVHAGLLPQWTVPDAVGLAQEFECALRSHARVDLLSRLYTSNCPQWSGQSRGVERLKVIANVMTRMRICTADGVVAWNFKGPVTQVPRGHYPWFDAPGRQNTEVRIVCGHWAALGLRCREDLIALDTGCAWGRHLSAFRLEDGAIFQVSCVK